MINENDKFDRARLESLVDSAYEAKVFKNTSRMNFIDAYTNSKGQKTKELIEATRLCFMGENGIDPKSCPKYKLDVSNNMIRDLYLKIKGDVRQNFSSFYKSYQRKINRGYNDEYISSALNDLKIAYYTLRKSEIPGYKCPLDMITESEMDNLYSLINTEKKAQGEKEDTLEK